jgi:ADP-heptose:LPS heptosyltransferase
MVGDLVNTTGAIQRLREHFSGATFVIEGGAAVCELFPDMEVWVRKRHGGLRGKIARILAIRKGGFDRALVLDDSRDKIRTAVLAGIPNVIGVARDCTPIRGAKILAFDTNGHDLFDPLRSILRELGVEGDVAPHLPITKAHRDLACELVREAKMILHVGASDLAKSWPAENWVDLARALGDACVVVAGPGEEALRDTIAETAGVASLPTMKLLDYAAVIERAKAVVTADTSAAHIAGAVGTRSIVLYGPTRPSRFAPWQLSTPLWHDLGCDHYGSGCALRKGGTCPHTCMAAITCEEVRTALNSP